MGVLHHFADSARKVAATFSPPVGLLPKFQILSPRKEFIFASHPALQVAEFVSSCRNLCTVVALDNYCIVLFAQKFRGSCIMSILLFRLHQTFGAPANLQTLIL